MQGKVAAMHAHVPELEARLAELQAELAPLVQQHQTLTQELPWARQLVRNPAHLIRSTPQHVCSCVLFESMQRLLSLCMHETPACSVQLPD